MICWPLRQLDEPGTRLARVVPSRIRTVISSLAGASAEAGKGRIDSTTPHSSHKLFACAGRRLGKFVVNSNGSFSGDETWLRCRLFCFTVESNQGAAETVVINRAKASIAAAMHNDKKMRLVARVGITTGFTIAWPDIGEENEIVAVTRYRFCALARIRPLCSAANG